MVRSLSLFYIFSLSIYHQISVQTLSKTDLFFCYSEDKTRKNVPPAGRLQEGPPGAPPAAPPHQPAGGRGRGFAATTSALIGSSAVCCSHINSHIIKSVVTGQAPVTLELRNTPGKKHKPKVVHAYSTADVVHTSTRNIKKSEIGSQPTMCQIHTGAYVSLLAPGKTDYQICRLPPKKGYHVYIAHSAYHYAYVRQTQANWKKETKNENKIKERKDKKTKNEGGKEMKEKTRKVQERQEDKKRNQEKEKRKKCHTINGRP